MSVSFASKKTTRGSQGWVEDTQRRKEGFMLTFEAVARAVSVLEGGGSGMLAQLLAPLELMTRHQ
ncbi:hypothetical protein HaLaN_05632, partial [Haematococcus lacustris]